MADEVKVEEVKPVDDIDTRLKGFNEELTVLLGKYELGLGSQPLLTTDGRISAQPIVVDARKIPKEEPKPPAPDAGLSTPEQQ